jgi:hypothetical protein
MKITPPKRYQLLQPNDRVKLASLIRGKFSIQDIAQVPLEVIEFRPP